MVNDDNVGGASKRHGTDAGASDTRRILLYVRGKMLCLLVIVLIFIVARYRCVSIPWIDVS